MLIPRAGVQCDSGVLLGTVSRGVELRRSEDTQHTAPDHQAGVDRGARHELEGGGLLGVQYLHLVDEHPQDESPVRAKYFAIDSAASLTTAFLLGLVSVKSKNKRNNI